MVRFLDTNILLRYLAKAVTAMISARPITDMLGTGIVIPSATKNSVMKKSRSVVTLAVTSSA